MSFIYRFFHKKRSTSPENNQGKGQVPAALITQEYARLVDFMKALNNLLIADKYLARSDYKRLVEDYAELNAFFQNQKAAKTLGYYCSSNGIPAEEVEAFLRDYADLSFPLIDGLICR